MSISKNTFYSKRNPLIIISSAIFLLNCRKATSINELKNEDLSFSIRIVNKDIDNRPSKIKIKVIKNNKDFQDIMYSPGTWLSVTDSLSINQINYFSSGKKITEGVENFHNFIIADLNFDGFEDFAILYYFGGSGGPVYSYYFQDKNDGTFKTEKQFPLNEGPFPKNIDGKNNTLTISGPRGCCKVSTTIFQLKNNKWDVLSSKEEDMK